MVRSVIRVLVKFSNLETATALVLEAVAEICSCKKEKKCIFFWRQKKVFIRIGDY